MGRSVMRYGEVRVLDLLRRITKPPVEIINQPYLSDFRADAAVLDPLRGVVLYEVKDYAFENGQAPKGLGRLGFELKQNPAGGWYPLGRDPVEQVLQYMDLLIDECTLLSGSALPWRQLVRGVVVMTDASTAEAQAWARDRLGWPRDGVAVLGGKDLPGLEPQELIPLPSHEATLMGEHAEALRTFLDRPRVVKEMAAPLELGTPQRRIAETRTPTGRRRVKGAAGSGKTQALAARAGELSRAGNSVLVTCFNATLPNYLRMLFLRHKVSPDGEPWVDPSRVVFIHFHRWAKWTIDLGGHKSDRDALDVGNDEDNRAYGDLARRVLAQQREKVPPFRFDAVLVDEGQDFYAEWWQALEMACTPRGEMLVVADDTQNLYQRGTGWTERMAGFRTWMTLQGSYRAPADLIPILRSFAERYLASGAGPVYLPRSPAEQLSFGQCDLRWISAANQQALAPLVHEELRRLRQEGVHDGDITLLVTNKQCGEGLARDLRSIGYQLSDIFGEDQDRKKRVFRPLTGRISLTTIHSYKGWQSRATIMVLDSATKSGTGMNALVYVGLTRAQASLDGSYLTVINASQSFEDWGRHAFHAGAKRWTACG